MDKLAETLRAAGVDVSTLEMIFHADMEAIHRLTVPGAEAIQTWERLRGLVPQTGYWPVLLGDDRDLEDLREHLERLRYPRAARILEEAATLDPEKWFENCTLDAIDAVQRELEEDDDPYNQAQCKALLSVEGPYRGMPQGPWPEKFQPIHSYWIPDRGSGEPRPCIHIGLVSTPLGWQVSAYLRYGAWNSCPSAAEHVALHKFWSDQYGAEVVAMADEVIEMKVTRPPTQRDAALALAAQQYLYCQDIVTQGTKTLQRLAAELLDDATWFFWWDWYPGRE